MATKSTSRKKTQTKKLAPLGLWFSGVALLAGIVFLGIKLLVLMQIYNPANGQWVNTALLISLGAFVIGVATFALLDPDRVRKFISGRQARNGSNALITLIALFGIIIVVNLLVFQNQEPWDWTDEKQHTLAPETLDTLAALPSPVTVLCFFTQNFNAASAESLLINFRDNSDGNFDFEIIDPESNPALAQQYGITRDGTIILTLGESQEVLNYASEQEFTSALVRLMNPGERVVYFVIGHGEADILASNDLAYTSAVIALEAKNYTVLTLNLRAENEIPSDALALIIAGPTQPITVPEVSLISDYLNGGGSLILLEQPTLETASSTPADPLQNYLAATWGIIFNNDIVIDPSTDQLTYAISYTYGEHIITENLQNTITFFPVARSLSFTQPSAEIQASPLVLTIDRAWGETDFDALAINEFDYQAPDDFAGPLTIAAVLENSTTGAQLAVFGDSSFATDTFYDQYGNADLFINTIDWASGEADMISLTAKEPTQRSLVPVQNFGWVILGLSFICIIPGIIVAGGIISWIARRSRG